MIREKNKKMFMLFAGSVALFFLSFFVFKFNLLMGSLFLFIIIISIFTCFYNLQGLFLFVLVRPLVDIFTDYNIVDVFGFGLNLASLMGVFIIFFSFYYLFKNLSKFKGNKVFYFWTIFLLINIFSVIFSVDIGNSFREIVRLTSIFSLFISGYLFVNNAVDLTKALKFVILSAILPAIIGIWQVVYAKEMLVEGGFRLASTFAHPNMLAFFMFFVLSITIFIFLYGYKKNVLSYFYIIASILFFSILVLTYTRGAWLALLIFLIIIGLFKFRKLLFLMLTIFLILYSTVSPLQHRINDIFISNNYDSSITWRLNLYKDGLEYFKEKPVIGYGAGNSSLVIAENRDPHLGSTEPHNDYLKAALETGAAGLISYILLLITLIISLFRKYREEIAVKIKYFNFFMIAISLSLIITSFSDNILNDTALQWPLWFIIGGILGLNNYIDEYN